ncbi:MAG: TAXI family TRAP transporter solute-binding subunit [Proteobacteria bacterium]|nr:TAXI family TRAP transporter solute-binding subunit [Pseudomonadota bacterium]MDA1060094.1 TAXI family TRAP transporter solute-binding subunit [Pseudomonadota bacterium]
MNKRTLLGFVGATVLAMSLASGAQAQQLLRVSGGLAGTYPLFAAKLTELINKNIPDVKAAAVSGDSVKAQIDLQNGQVDYKIGYTYDVKRIADGLSTVPIKTPDVCHIMTLYGSGLFAVAKTDGIKNLRELGKGKYRMWTGSKTGFFFNLVSPALEAHGVDILKIEKDGTILESFGYGDTVTAFQDRRLDVTYFSGGIPYSLMLQLENSPGFHLIDWDDEALTNMSKIRPGIFRGVVPAGSYKGQDKDVNVPWYVNQLVTNSKLPVDLTYQVTKIMNEQAKEFHGLFGGSTEIGVNDPLENNQVPVCEGAKKYYREKGKM